MLSSPRRKNQHVSLFPLSFFLLLLFSVLSFFSLFAYQKEKSGTATPEEGKEGTSIYASRPTERLRGTSPAKPARASPASLRVSTSDVNARIKLSFFSAKFQTQTENSVYLQWCSITDAVPQSGEAGFCSRSRARCPWSYDCLSRKTSASARPRQNLMQKSKRGYLEQFEDKL